MSDSTNEHEERAYCAECVWDAGAWERQPVDQILFGTPEPEMSDTMKRIARWVDFIDR